MSDAEEELKKAKLYALRRLSKQAMLSTALAKAFHDRKYSQATIDCVILEFTEAGYLNDDQWIAGYIRTLMARRLGTFAIKHKLAEKGISYEKIEEMLRNAFEECCKESSQEEAILSLLQTKYQKRDLNDYKEKQKVIASLCRRGFDLSTIVQVISVGK